MKTHSPHLTVLVSLVGAHLVHGVDGVADGAVDDGLLGLVQARLGVVAHARDELGPHLGVRVAGTQKGEEVRICWSVMRVLRVDKELTFFAINATTLNDTRMKCTAYDRDIPRSSYSSEVVPIQVVTY